MSLDRYRLLAQRGAGSDGIAYKAQVVETGAPVEVRVLTDLPLGHPRRQPLAKRLKLASLMHHPSGLEILEQGLDHDPPYVALEWADGNGLDKLLAPGAALPVEEALTLVQGLAGALVAAHRLGLVHGNLRPASLLLTKNQTLKADFTGLIVGPRPTGDGPTSGEAHDPAEDVRALGALCQVLLNGLPPDVHMTSPAGMQTVAQDGAPAAEVDELLQAMCRPDPADRPTAKEVETRLTELLRPLVDTNPLMATAAGAAPGATPDDQDTMVPLGDNVARDRLGRFKLMEKLGQGGMGTVYRATDLGDGAVVAVKVLRPEWARKPEALRRFHKEARLMAEVNNPYVANLIEVNEDEGIHYLVLEYAAGKNLNAHLEKGGPLDEKTALAVAADVARALADAHQRGIVHRDIKPENIILVGNKDGRVSSVKVLDFGLARHVVESESLNLTQAGAVLGTPLYMAPEQCVGIGAISPRTDVYALGATLFHMLAGRPPFLGPNPLAVMSMHRNDPPPPLKKYNPQASEAVCQVVEKCLAKAPEGRYADAGAFLDDAERLLRGQPTSILAHPRLPDCDPKNVTAYDWTWDLEAAPEHLWPYVSNTERLNRAVGLPAVRFTTKKEDQKGVQRFGEFRKAGLTASWEEHPFEWVEGRRLGVLRQYSQGPFKWLMSVVELAPRVGGGTTLTHRVRLEPSGFLGRTVAAVEVNLKGRRALDKVYHRIDAALTGKLGGKAVADPFEEAPGLSGARRRRLDALLDQLGGHGIDPAVVERLGDFVAHAPAQEVSRVRPIALARRLDLPAEQVVAACLHGTRDGLFQLLWDILCPSCRIPFEVKDTLRALREHGRCEACDLDFDLDFANSVEMIFRAHPDVRDAETGVFCIGGPSHSPHVVAQVRVAPGERVELELALAEGTYRLRGPQLSFSLDFRAQPKATASRWDLALTRPPAADLPRALKPGRQVFVLTNDHAQELVVRVERTAPRDDALTAARASSLALFRELFPGEVLSPGRLVSVANVTLLVTQLDQAEGLYRRHGDARAFATIHEHFRLLGERVRQEGGALVKTVGEGILAAFQDPASAVTAGLDLAALLRGNPKTADLGLKAGVHRGPAMAATLNDHLDYFGSTVNLAAQLPEFARAGDLILTPAVAADPVVAGILQARGLEGAVVESALTAPLGGPLQRIVGK